MLIFLLRKFIFILIFNILFRCTMRRIYALNGGNNAFLSVFGAYFGVYF